MQLLQGLLVCRTEKAGKLCSIRNNIELRTGFHLRQRQHLFCQRILQAADQKLQIQNNIRGCHDGILRQMRRRAMRRAAMNDDIKLL